MRTLYALFIGDVWLSKSSLTLKGVFDKQGLDEAIETLIFRAGLSLEQAEMLVSHRSCTLGENGLMIEEVTLNKLDDL